MKHPTALEALILQLPYLNLPALTAEKEELLLASCSFLSEAHFPRHTTHCIHCIHEQTYRH